MGNDISNAEKLYKRLSISGGGNIVIGIVAIVAGLACGVFAIISGAKLLKSRSKIMY